MTNPSILVTKRALPDGWLRHRGRLLISQWVLWLGFSFLAALINAISGIADSARSGASTPAWEHYVSELTSWFGFAVVVPALFALDNALAARKDFLLRRLAIYAAFSVIFSGLHIALMMGARPPIFALFGDDYEIGSWLSRFAYEYPKDIMTYLIVLGVAALQRRSMPADAPVEAPADASASETAPAPSFIARGQAGETVIRVAEIDWVEAQGNYVALHVGGNVFLVRRTLQEVDAALTGFGFVRTHRSAMVRSSLIRSLGVAEDGSLFVSLNNGERVPLSRGRKQSVRATLSS